MTTATRIGAILALVYAYEVLVLAAWLYRIGIRWGRV